MPARRIESPNASAHRCASPQIAAAPAAGTPSGVVNVGPSASYISTPAIRPSSGRAPTSAKNASANAARPSSAAARSGATTASSYTPSARHSRAWISHSGSVPGAGSNSGGRRWKTLRGNSRLKNVHSHFSYCDAAGNT